jgi:hypothetical protein
MRSCYQVLFREMHFTYSDFFIMSIINREMLLSWRKIDVLPLCLVSSREGGINVPCTKAEQA